MDKHGYKQREDDPTVKVAAKEGVCPACGAKTTGSPPVCPNCGSKPFEERPDGEKEED